jgi:site-specific DNA-methyltransferase (adenine-specific)
MIYNKDSRLLREDVQPSSIHAVVTDPPYGMNIMNNEWDKILPPAEVWKACFDVLLPGGFLLAFGHTRLYHRVGCQIEDAGFEIKDCLCWTYATNFSHPVNAGVEIDEHCGYRRHTYDDHGELTEGVTEEGKKWNGYMNGLKRSWEPIIMAQKPMEGKIAENVLKYKCGVLNVDACRIPYASDEDRESLRSFSNFKGQDCGDARYFSANEGGKKQANVHPLGRFPANLMWLDPLYAKYDHIFMIPKPVKGEKRSYNHHDTVKPLRLMRHLVSLVTPNPSVVGVDVTVLDPYMGSGTTGVACTETGRKFIGYEIDKKSFETSKKRIDEPRLADLFD